MHTDVKLFLFVMFVLLFFVCLKNYFRRGAWPSSRDPVNCRAFSANSYKIVEAIPYGLQICVSSNKVRIGNRI